MTKLEYIETLKILESLDLIDILHPDKLEIAENQKINIENTILDLRYSGTYYCIVNGIIPLEIAEAIYKKYPNVNQFIKIAGYYNNREPKQFAKKDGKGNLYVDYYHIESKEGLLILLSEIKNYHLNILSKTDKLITEDRAKKIMLDINKAIILKLNPKITGSDWINSKSSSGFKETKLDKKILDSIIKFDKTINPFIENENPNNYIYNLVINAALFNETRENCATMYLVNKDTNNKTMYIRNDTSLNYKLFYRIGNELLEVTHYYRLSNNDVIEYIEFIEKEKTSKYNITSGTKIINNKEIPLTNYEKKNLYKKLEKAINYAETVTVDSKNSNNYAKKLSLA